VNFISSNDVAMGNLGYDRVEADFYPTPGWLTEAVVPFLRLHGVTIDTHVWEPACGDGAMSGVLARSFDKVTSTDLHNYGAVDARAGVDFLKQDVHWKGSIVTNPPYGDLAEAFIRHALKVTTKHRGVVAMLLRNEYDCAKGRSDLFRLHPFARKLVLTTRPRWIEDSTGAPRHNYSWFIWDWARVTSDPILSYHLKGK